MSARAATTAPPSIFVATAIAERMGQQVLEHPPARDDASPSMLVQERALALAQRDASKWRVRNTRTGEVIPTSLVQASMAYLPCHDDARWYNVQSPSSSYGNDCITWYKCALSARPSTNMRSRCKMSRMVA